MSVIIGRFRASVGIEERSSVGMYSVVYVFVCRKGVVIGCHRGLMWFYKGVGCVWFRLRAAQLRLIRLGASTLHGYI